MPVLKRPAGAKAKAAPAKKPRVDEVGKQIGKVAGGLHLARSSPDEVVQMVAAMLEPALRTFADDRHSFEQHTVQMAEQILQGVDEDYAKQVADAASSLASLDAQEQERLAEAEKAEAHLSEEDKVVVERKNALAQVALAFRQAKQAKSQADAEYAAREAAMQGILTKKEKLAAVEATHLKPVVDGTAEAEAVGELEKEGKAAGLDASLLVALSTVAGKAPSDRGAFDAMVLAQLAEAFANRIGEFEAALRDGEAAKAAVADAAAVAEKTAAAAREQQLSAAAAFKAANAKRQAAEAVAAEAREALAAVPAARRGAQRAAATAERRLEAFRSGPLATFLALRDRAAPPPSPPPADEAAEDAKAAPAEAAADVAMAEAAAGVAMAEAAADVAMTEAVVA